MSKDIAEVVFILDRSGSMSGLEADTIGGFNAMLAKQKKQEGQAYISTILFDNESQVLHDRVEVEKVAPLTDKDYSVGGCTALLDAVGGAIHHISNIHKYAREEDVPRHTIFAITTDGLENASHRYSRGQVKEMIEEKKERGWEFIFLGANIDAVETARNYGIAADHTANFINDSWGTSLNFMVLSDALSSIRSNKGLKKDWKKQIDQDYQERKKK